MPHKYELLTIALLLAMFASLLLTPVAIRVAMAAGVLDTPHARRVHTHPTPRWGGLAMCASFIICVLALAPSCYYLLKPNVQQQVVGILVCGLMITVLGALDDKYNMPAKLKLLGQVVIATLVVMVFRVRFVVIFDVDLNLMRNWFGVLLTIVWIVSVTNTINLIDGLDGLAAGISGIAALTFLIISLIKGSVGEALLAMIVLGICLGFLRYNFHPAKVFMGDAGSHFLGFTIATLSVLLNWKVATGVALAVPVLILAVPIFDTLFAIVRRLRRGQPIFSPDKGHLHHQLLNLGLDQRTVVIMIYIFTMIGCALAVLLTHARIGR